MPPMAPDPLPPRTISPERVLDNYNIKMSRLPADHTGPVIEHRISGHPTPQTLT